jgi:hypothetical protein
MSIREPKLPRRTLKGARSFEDVSIWGSQVDDSLRDIVIFSGDVLRAINSLTVQTPSAIIVPHAAQHLPLGTDPIAYAIPVSIGSANAIGGANSFANSAHVHQGVHSVDAGGADLYGDVTFAASGTGLTVGQSGQTITYTLATGAGSGLDADTLDGIDSLGFIKANGTVPLTSAWDAGNFAITLGSVVGKSGNLSIAAAASGGLTLSGSTGSIVFNPSADSTITMAVPGTAGSGAATLLAVAATSGLGVSRVLSFQVGVNTTSLTASGILATLTQTGTGSSYGIFVAGQHQAGTTNLSGQRCVAIESQASYSAASAMGNKTTDRLSGVTSVLGWANNSAIGGVAAGNMKSWGFFTGNASTPNPLPGLWAGYICGSRPTGLGDAASVGFHSREDIQLETNATYTGKLIFDGVATLSPSITQGSTTFTALTKGTSYMVYNRATPRIDVFAVGAQAFHFDAGGAAGTSRCYGNMLISGTTTSTGLITASVGLTATTGDIRAEVGDVFSASDLRLNVNGRIVFDTDGTDNDYMQFASSLLRTTLGGVTISDFYSGGQELGSGMAYRINAGRIILNETSLTHDPASEALFTFTLKDALLIQSNGNATTRNVCDIFRNSSTGTRTMLKVRDSTTSAFDVVSAAGVPQIGFYGVAPASRPAAYTQTYATAARTHVAAAVATTAATNIGPFGYTTAAQADAIPVAINELKALINAMIDDRQADGLAQ